MEKTTISKKSVYILGGTGILTFLFVLLNLFIDSVDQFKKEYGTIILVIFAIINIAVLFYEWKRTGDDKYKY